MQTIHVPVSYSQAEIVEFSSMCAEYIHDNPKASREEIVSAVVTLTEAFETALRLRYNLPQFNQ